jgi:hypothetical protein
MNLEVSRQVFEKCPYMEFHENPSSGNRVICGRTERHNEAASRFSQFCERAESSLLTRKEALFLISKTTFFWRSDGFGR